MRPRAHLLLLLLTAVATRVEASVEATALPSGDVFASLLADPKQPRVAAATVATRNDDDRTILAVTSVGESIGLLRFTGGDGRVVQIGLMGAVLAQFDLLTPSSDMLNADFLIGVPLTVRRGPHSARARLYHQSSHVGDEYLLAEAPRRVNFSYIALELLLDRTREPWRIYGGAELFVHRAPESLPPLEGHVGGEYRGTSWWRFGEASLRPLGGVDLKAYVPRGGGVDVSLKAGVALEPEDPAGRSWVAFVTAFRGRTPFGQFFAQQLVYYGAGIDFAL